MLSDVPVNCFNETESLEIAQLLINTNMGFNELKACGQIRHCRVGVSAVKFQFQANRFGKYTRYV